MDTVMATTETSATDSKIIMKDTTEQNKTDSRDERMKIHQVAAVSVVAITVSIDKISNHSKTNTGIHIIT